MKFIRIPPAAGYGRRRAACYQRLLRIDSGGFPRAFALFNPTL